MTIDPNSIGQVAGIGRVQSGANSGEARGQPPLDPASGAAFRALLEKIEENARALDRASESIKDPRQLGEAVSSARESVEQAVLLGSDLIEAYRAAERRASANDQPSAPRGASHTQDSKEGSGGGR